MISRKSLFVIRTRRVPYLLNKAFRTGISVGDIIIGEGEVSVTVSRANRRAFKALLQEEGVDFEDKTKKIPFRPVLIAAMCAVLSALLFFQSFVYEVHITGNRYVNTASIESVLRLHNVDGFTYKRSIDLDAVKRDVTALEGVSFTSVGIRGNTLFVDVKEEFPADAVDAENHSPVLATYSGVITKVVAESGTACVKAGDVVSVGDTLIEPLYRFTEGEASAPAKGEVWARVVYRKEVFLPQISVQNVRTGNSFSVRILRVFGKEYSSAAQPIYAQYDVTDRVMFSCGFVSVTERTYYERADTTVAHDFEVEAPSLLSEARKALLSEVPFYAYATGGVVAEEKKMDNMFFAVLYYCVVQRIDSLFLPNGSADKEAMIWIP